MNSHFKIKYQFLIFTNYRYLKTNMQNGNKRNSKTKGRMTMKIIHRATNHEARFLIYLLSNLNYVAKFPNWSVAGYHGNHFKNPAS